MIVKFGRNKNHAFCEMERQKYVHCENQVFIFLIDATVEEWWVWFDLANRYKGDIDKWLKFALPRRVQGLLLDLSMNGHHMRLFVKSCTIPYEMLGLIEGTTVNYLSSRFCIIHFYFNYVMHYSLLLQVCKCDRRNSLVLFIQLPTP